MAEQLLNIHLVLDNKSINVPYNSSTTAEDVCIHICKQLSIGTVSRHLFALRNSAKQTFLMPAATFTDKQLNYEFRMRFKVAKIEQLARMDMKAYDYYFYQARNDILENKIPGLNFESHGKELLGLGISDMYRVMLEKDIPRETIQKEYKKYIPKQVVRQHWVFIKTPIQDTLKQLQKCGRDAKFVKSEYLKQFNTTAPEYLCEQYKAHTEIENSVYSIIIKVSPFDIVEPGLKYCLESKKDEWYQICTIDEISFVSIRFNEGTVEISRKNGIPFYLRFSTLPILLSVISLLDGYYRLMCKWTFNICKDVVTPSLQKLYAIRCHGPVGGEFSYAKLEDKRSNRPGCFIIRESETKYNNYYIDVCLKGSSKPKTFKLERITGDEFIFNDDLTRYKSIQQLMQAYSDPKGAIYLQECLPPSEYDKSPLLLCQNENFVGESVTDSLFITTIIPKDPLVINSKDLQIYKDRKCLKWNKDRDKVRENNEYVKYSKFPKSRFPDSSLKNSKKYCRNPNGDIGGPWCFVENDDTNDIEREYCDIPFCNEPDCFVFTKNYSVYMHYTNFDNTLTNFTFGIKLWDPDSFLNASARLILTLLALPIDGKEIDDLGIGIEIFISNLYTTLTSGNKDKPDYKIITRNLLKSNEFTMFSLTWTAPFISLSVHDDNNNKEKEIFLAEFKTKKNLLGFKKNQFNYYSLQGTNILWSLPFCIIDQCDIYTTTGEYFQQFWPLHTTTNGYELKFYLRAFHSANILLVTTPTIDIPCIQIIFKSFDYNSTRILSINYKNGPVILLKELKLPNIINYWEWNEFSILLFVETMQIYLTKTTGIHLITELYYKTFHQLRWFSISSNNTVAHWSLYCKPIKKPPEALLPECALNKDEKNYKGSQSIISNSGLPCLPWSSKKVLPEINGMFNNQTIMKEWNYCRDPLNKFQGTFCYTLSLKPEKKIEKQFCQLRKCKSENCHMAGSGNDYIGTLNITRNNRTCDYWMSNETVHLINKEYLKNTLFPDRELNDIQNYCRNPSRDLAGSWCYTTDKDVTRDVCNVRDCDRPEEFIIILLEREDRQVYILPEWKDIGLHFSLKQWNPDLVDGIIFEISSLISKDIISLVIGSDFNERLLLYNNSDLLEEHTYPHLLSSGKWTDFWLKIHNDEILLGFKSIPDPFFEWKFDNNNKLFKPMFLKMFTIRGNPIGIFFENNNNQCHTENITNSNLFMKILPIGLWSECDNDNNNQIYKKFNLTVRGKGLAFIALIQFPGEINNYYLIQIDVDHNEINLFYQNLLLTSHNYDKINLINENSWSSFIIKFCENSLIIQYNNLIIFNYKSKNLLLFYWFSIGSLNGWLTWTVNCNKLLDIDGPPIDGGWSQWSPYQCTVSCGGGEGVRTRTCTNPSPNIFGKLCEGPSTSTGLCNNFECGDISLETIEMIRENLKIFEFSYVIKEGNKIILENDKEMLIRILKESPEAYYEWTFNGLYLSSKYNNIEIDNDNIIIYNASIINSGVYASVLYRINKKRLIIRVISLAVKAKNYSIKTRAARSISINCNSIVLGYIYSNLRLKLLLNNQIFIDYGITILAATNIQNFNYLYENYTGNWVCLIEQNDLKLSWITNYVRLQVLKKANFYTNLMEDKLTSPLFNWLKTERNVKIALVVILFIIFNVVLLFLFIYFKFCTLKTPHKWEGSRRITVVYKCMWKVAKGKKTEVARKVLKNESCNQYLKSFLELAGQWAFLQSNSIVRLYGITLTSDISYVLEYFPLGPLDKYLQKHKEDLQPVDLIEASSNLASALWHLKENGIVHGNIRCRKLMVCHHSQNSFRVKLTDPGIYSEYTQEEIHWIPPECYGNSDCAKRSWPADVWAFGTTLWEIFMFGKKMEFADIHLLKKWYLNNNRLSQPPNCPPNVYNLMKECWDRDTYKRKEAQAIMRDLNQLLYELYNSRRIHSYSKLFVKPKSYIMESIPDASIQSLNTLNTEITDVTNTDDSNSLNEISSNNYSNLQMNSQNFMNSQEMINQEYDFSQIMSQMNVPTSTNIIQSIYDLYGNEVFIEARIGEGNYGEVYRGTLCSPKENNNYTVPICQVAVKRLKSNALSAGLEDFEREINIVEALKHANIVEIIGVIHEPEVLLVMEYIQHGSLINYLNINREHLQTKQLLKFALDIAEGMKYLGEKNIVHRDLAARNILVVDENNVKISDFGLAQVIGANDDYYIMRTSREIPLKWYAPESLRDFKFSVRSDVWSYGVTMCELFNYGAEPQLVNIDLNKAKGHEQQILLNAFEKGARYPCPVSCPQSVFVRIVLPCWESNPHRRATFAQLISEIEDLLTQF